MNITYRLNNKETNTSGDKQIYVRLRGLNKKKKTEECTIGTGIYINEKYFVKGNISTNSPSYSVLNTKLVGVYNDIETVIYQMRSSKLFISPIAVKVEYLKYISNRDVISISYVTFWQAYDEFVDMRKHNTAGYLKTLKTLRNRLEEYEKWSKKKLSFDFILNNTNTFQFQLQDYLWTERNLSNSYVNKLLSNLSHFLYFCYSQRYITTRPKFKNNSTVDRDEKIYLYKEEVIKLFNSNQFNYEDGKIYNNNHIYIVKDVLEGSNKERYGLVRYYTNWELVKDTFLFLCSIGCRYSDIPSFKVNHFNFDENNSAFSWIQQKTNKRVVVPRNDISEFIFRKYARGKSLKQTLFPTISIQKFNKSLKLVLKELKFDRLVTYPKKIGSTVVNNEEVFLYELISSHSGRRTFIKNMIDMGTMDYQTIMKMSGHRTISQFQKYISVSPRDINKGRGLFKIDSDNQSSDETKLLNGFNKLSDKNKVMILELINSMSNNN
jgi:site-specific recombinase XerD